MKKQKRADKIIEEFIQQFKQKHDKDNINVDGVLLFGSYIKPSQISKLSDLDLYIVIKNNGKRYRGIACIDNIEVDYFVNPIELLKKDFEQALKAPKKTVVFMLAEGQIIQDSNKQLSELQSEALQAIKTLEKEQAQALPDFMITSTKYFIDDFLKDIRDNYDESDFFALEYNFNLLMNYLLESFCRQKGILLVKPKYQKDKIQKIDSRFVLLFEEVSDAKSKKERMKKIKRLSDYVLDSLGGKLPKEWELESTVIL